MKFFVLAACLLALAVLTKSQGDDKDKAVEDDTKKCRAWEVWRCASNNCTETSCELPTLGKYCDNACTEACVCDDGYFRDDLGDCVTWDHCTRG